jgi:DNA-binding NtrC family response regulator
MNDYSTDGQHQILLIEDDRRLGHTITLLFRSLPVQVTVAGDASCATEHLLQDQYDLLIFDFESLERERLSALFHADHHNLSHELIVLCDNTDKEKIKKALPCDKTSFLPKPFDPDKLIYIVEKSLQRTSIK